MNCYAPQVNKVSATPAPPAREVSWQTGKDHSAKRKSSMYHQLTEPERYTLSVLKREGRSLRDIALSMKRSPSTISREIRRNATIDHNRPRPLYVPSKAQEHANGRRRRSRRIKHHAPEIYEVIEDLLQRERSEEHTSELQSLMRTSYAVFFL